MIKDQKQVVDHDKILIDFIKKQKARIKKLKDKR
tara:strand:- start:441 stop:542 length:102 start_codon:yes stop_codon:yes gene_type:complete